MHDNDDDHRTFDYHEHPGHNYPHTHEHDNHPRHHHDRLGSIHYYAYLGFDEYRTRVVHSPDIDVGGADATPIGSGGYDITHRTPRPAPTHRPID